MNLFQQGDFTPTANPRLSRLAEAAKKVIQEHEMRILGAIENPPAELDGKKAWQMTREAWLSLCAPVKDAYDLGINFGIIAGDAFLKRHAFTHNAHEFIVGSISNSRHEVQVAYAMLRGDNIPAEVLAQYPKEHWSQTCDLRVFKHLPRYVVTKSEQVAALATWGARAARNRECLDLKHFMYETERDLTFYLKAYEQVCNELLMLTTEDDLKETI
jgi:hypothetical protein